MKMINEKISIFLAIYVLLNFGCDSLLDIDEKPSCQEGKTTLVIKVIDNTGIHTLNYKKNIVPKASLTLVSSSFGKEYKLSTNSEGIATLESFASDTYLINAAKEMTPEEMYKGTGKRKFNSKIINNNKEFEITARQKDTLFVKLDKVIIDSPLIFSEIYASGPTDAGLYFHDKYIELFNQSDTTVYLDGLLIARAYSIGYLGINWVNDSLHVHTKQIWYFPGSGKDYPLEPGQFAVAAEDALNHKINAPNSIDLTEADFEFYKADAPDLDNKATNMIMFYQTSGVDWLIGGKSDALIISNVKLDELLFEEERYLIPTESVLDGVEYLGDLSRLDKKKLYHGIDAAATGGIGFYTGKTMERKIVTREPRLKLKDNNNSLIDFNIYAKPSPGYHNDLK